MSETAQYRMEEAEALIKHPLLEKAFEELEKRYLDELLSGPPSDCPEPDRWRRERKGAMYAAKADMRKTGGAA